ncbi:threonine/serine exporter family protein [Kitasatospora sp. NBC_01250]|uniref:threonine/serine ThrE exporter family protein n=1 Tax=unclassified Kitasatospora TaxID=2633591 RepID=UPI002E163942|nr:MULTISPECIES: threonine/serine exporter family protein [unclassified Kitasatospora]WSJ65094.1 threonine/serine exporter family protein [Kitasatospora sp. NBC_01302]
MSDDGQLGAHAEASGRPGPGRVPPRVPGPRHAADAVHDDLSPAVVVPWPDRMLPLLRTPTADRPLVPDLAEADRPEPAEAAAVLDLALSVGELLLASGEAAEDVEAAMLAVARSYGLRPCDPQVTFTRVRISYQPGPADPPLTAEGSVRRPAGDYARLAAVFRLVTEVAAGTVEVVDAHRRLAVLSRHHHRFPGWLLVFSSGLLAGSATLLVGGRVDARAWLVFALAFVTALVGDRLAALVARHDLPAFYQFVLAATPAAAIGILLSFNGLQLRGSVVITGGLYALLPGWPMVAAVQDGLAGFYLTAAARLLEAVFLMAGVVIGVMTVLYVGVSNGAALAARDAPAGEPYPPVQLAAAMVLTLAFAVLLNTEPGTLPLVLLNSAVGWTTYGVLVNAGGESIVATGVAAGIVGLFGQLMARYRGNSALPHITAALGPLLPGSALYFGMLAFVRGESEAGLSRVGRAVAMAMALAIGMSLGREVARLFLPVRVTPVFARRGGRHRR